MNLNMRIKNIISFIIVLCLVVLSFCTITFAENTTATNEKKCTAVAECIENSECVVTNIIQDSYEGFYKNFIIELGGVKVSLIDNTGTLIWQKYVLPKQFSNASKKKITIASDQDKVNKVYILGEEVSISDTNIKFSDNLPQLTESIDADFPDTKPYIYFTEWTEYKDVNSWLAEPANLTNLLSDIGETESFNNIFYTATAEGIYPTLHLEPYCYYPRSTEEIICNKYNVANEYNLYWHSGLFNAIGTMLSEKIKLTDLVSFLFGGYTIYEHFGIIDWAKVKNQDKSIRGNILFEAPFLGLASSAGLFAINVQVNELLTGKGFVMLTYSEASQYVAKWKIIDVVNNTDSKTISDENLHKQQYREAIGGLTEEEAVAAGMYSYQEWLNSNGLTDSETTIGGFRDSTIPTEHNKLFSVIPVSNDEIIKKTQDFLSSKGYLLTSAEGNVYKYGAALILGGALSPTDQILIKFHSNLEQIGGSGSIDEDYNLIGTIGSSEYTWQKTGTKVSKFPYTYSHPLDATDGEGNKYDYCSYTTIQGEEGKQGGGGTHSILTNYI